MRKEGQSGYTGDLAEPRHSASLPPDLERFLQTKDLACLTHETNQGTIFVVKLTADEIAKLHGRVPMHVRHELYHHPKAPVTRTVIRIYDRFENPLGLETFTNVEQEDQRSDFLRLADQSQVYLLFYGDLLLHRLTNGMESADPKTIREIVEMADQLRMQIPVEAYDFDLAKADVVARTEL